MCVCVYVFFVVVVIVLILEILATQPVLVQKLGVNDLHWHFPDLQIVSKPLKARVDSSFDPESA